MIRTLKSWRLLAILIALVLGWMAAQAAVGGGIALVRNPSAKMMNPFNPTIEPAPTSLLITQQPLDASVVPSLDVTTTGTPTPPLRDGSADVTPITLEPGPVLPLGGPIRRPPVRDPFRPPTRSPFKP